MARALSVFFSLILFSIATSASAYEIRLVQTTPGGMFPQGAPGDVVSFDAYLDTQGQSDIMFFAVGLSYEASLLTYEPALSDAVDYVLYTPGNGPAEPASWLYPESDPFALWPAPEPGREQVMLAFIAPGFEPTRATATNAYLGTISLLNYTPWLGGLQFDFDHGGSAFAVSDGEGGALYIEDQVATTIVWSPEPSTALLVGVGLVATAWRSKSLKRSGGGAM